MAQGHLKRGDRVRVIAPGGAFERSRLDAGLDSLVSAGLVPVVDDTIGTRDRYFAGDETRRFNELQAALQDNTCTGIWAARGGYGTAQLLTKLTPEVVHAAGKLLIGFSDITALHMLWLRAGLPSVHGANVINFPQWSAEHQAEMLKILMEPTHTVLEGEGVGSGTVTGTLTGGNLTVLASMAGTGQLASWRDCIVLLEDVGERPYRLDRCLNQLWQAGAFEGVRGICIGQLTDCDDKNLDYTALGMFQAFLPRLQVPVVHSLALGHDPTSRAVRFGVPATLDAGRATLSVG